MRTASKIFIIAVAILALPAFMTAQCTDKCAGSCLKKAAETFVKSVPGNDMFLMPVETLAEMVDAGKNDYMILDIRPPKHYASGHIDGSINIPLLVLVEKLDSVPTDKKIAVICSLDTNSAFGVAVLRMHNRNAWIVEGGIFGWEGLERPLIK
ncbi:MAG: rhodanese-like domain-containing protein [candidate division WOR-3 bacterium]|nr:MAG: rhodanese-like domain-containing protein [candidate division WOR-3 bacterium]